MLRLIGVGRGAALATALAFCLASPVGAANVGFTGVAPEDAVGGYDAVELSEGKRVKGQGRYTYVFQGRQWRFANDANRQQFRANPGAYMQAQQ